MLANLKYAAVVLHTGASVFQPGGNALEYADVRRDVAASEYASQTWSDKSYRFVFGATVAMQKYVTEAQSETLHRALLASFDKIISPIMID